jgi:hypothetical protein
MDPLEARVTARITGLDAPRRAALYRAVEAAETAVQLFHRHRAGADPVPHPIALTPFVVPRRHLPALARLAAAVHRLQAAAPALYRADVGGFRALCPVSEATVRWLEHEPVPAAPWRLMIRPDVGLEAGGARAAPAPILFETNSTALAGLYNHAAGVRILRREVFPRVLTAAERRRLADPPDLLALTVRWVLRAARRLGRARPRGVAFVEEAGPVAGYSEIPRLVHAFRSRGLTAVHGPPEALRLRGDAVYLGSTPVDLVYRDLAVDDLGAPPPAGSRRLAAFRERLGAGAVLPGLAGEFSHKGLLECLTRREFAGLFTARERRLLARAVPWTRVLGARRTTDPAGRTVDLPAWVRRHAARLLIKPNLGSSGSGVLLGREASSAAWDARLARALREPGGWVVQARRPGTRRPMVYLRAGRAFAGPCFFSLGLFYAPGDLGLHCRISRGPVVNVARQGALACAFVSD